MVDSRKTKISPYTNRLVTCEVPPPIFWCAVCRMKITSPSSGIQHFIGKSHKAKVFLSENRKGKLTETSDITNVLGKKRKKEEEDDTGDTDNYCNYCNVPFTSVPDALLHYSGRKHAAKVAVNSFSALQKNKKANNNQQKHKKNKFNDINNVRYGIVTAGIHKSAPGGSVQMKNITRATVPGARQSLSDYFVKATEAPLENVNNVKHPASSGSTLNLSKGYLQTDQARVSVMGQMNNDYLKYQQMNQVIQNRQYNKTKDEFRSEQIGFYDNRQKNSQYEIAMSGRPDPRQVAFNNHGGYGNESSYHSNYNEHKNYSESSNYNKDYWSEYNHHVNVNENTASQITVAKYIPYATR